MSTYQFDHEIMPTPEEFARLLRVSDEQYDPVEELLSLERELADFEQKHNLSSSKFYRQYQDGQIGDAVEFVSWAGRYKLYQDVDDNLVFRYDNAPHHPEVSTHPHHKHTPTDIEAATPLI